MKLYEIAENMKELERLVETEEFTLGELQDTIEAVQGEFEEKVKGCLMVRQNCLAQADAIRCEIERLDSLMRSQVSTADLMLDYVKFGMLKTETDKMDLGLFKLTLREASKKLGDIDCSKVPNEFFLVVPETIKLDKRALLKAAKESPVDGVTLIDSERALTVK